MNLFSVIIAVLLAVLTLAFSVMLVAAIVFNMKAGTRYRKALASRVEKLRLNRMLTALGIDIDHYLHTQPTVDIQQHMKRCSACENTDTCDDRLAQGEIKASDIDFCNNERALQDVERNMHSK
ncbi:MAG: hypothetical protein GWP13_01065 [Planctomycetia bacterium]|nr:hypothetical protein [Planctomycetia bacterium]